MWHVGGGEQPDCPLGDCTRASLLLGSVISFLLLAGTWIWSTPLLRLAGAQDDYLPLALQYAYPALASLALSGPAIVLHGIRQGWGIPAASFMPMSSATA